MKTNWLSKLWPVIVLALVFSACTADSDPVGAQKENEAGLAAQEAGKWDEALEHYQEAVRLDGANPVYHMNLATALEIKSEPDYDKAIAEYQRAIELDRNLCPAYNSLGYRLREFQRYGEAVKVLTVGLSCNSGEVWQPFIEYRLLTNLGRTYFEAGMYEDAMFRLEEAAGMVQQVRDVDHYPSADTFYFLARTYEFRAKLGIATDQPTLCNAWEGVIQWYTKFSYFDDQPEWLSRAQEQYKQLGCMN